MGELDSKKRLSTEELILSNCGNSEVLRNPWTARSNQSILKEVNSEYSLVLKVQYFGHLMWRADSLEKNNRLLILWLSTVILEPKKIKSDAGKDWRQEEKGVTEDEMVGYHHGLSGHEFEQTPGDVKDRKVWHAAFIGLQSQTWLSNWTATKRECI